MLVRYLPLLHRRVILVQSPTVGMCRRTLSGNFPKGVDVLDDPTSLKCTIKKYSKTSFVVNNVHIRSSVILFPNFYLQWRVRQIDALTIEDLSIFTLLYPPMQILIIGCGQRLWTNRARMAEISAFFRQKGVAVEFLPTNQASATFNILNGEGRDVAAALITIEPVSDFEESELVVGTVASQSQSQSVEPKEGKEANSSS